MTATTNRSSSSRITSCEEMKALEESVFLFGRFWFLISGFYYYYYYCCTNGRKRGVLLTIGASRTRWALGFDFLPSLLLLPWRLTDQSEYVGFWRRLIPNERAYAV